MATGNTKGKREAIWPSDVPRPMLPYSPAIKAGGWVFISGQVATDGKTGVPAEAQVDPESPYLGNQLECEARYIMKNLTATLKAAGCDIAQDVVRIYTWLKSAHPTYEEFVQGSSTTGVAVDPYARVFQEVFAEPRPASTGMGVRDLLVAGTQLEVDLIAMEPRPELQRRAFDLPGDVPQPVVKYSPALRSGDWIFLAGDLATDFQGDFLSERHLGEPSGIAPEARVNPYFWYGSSIAAQTDYLLRKLEKIAQSAGTSLDRCVKADVYIGHPQDLYDIDRVWQRWFPNKPPARSVIPYMGLAARGCRIEISLTLLAGDSSLRIETIETSEAPEPFGHQPQAVKAGPFLFFSTQLPVDSQGRIPAELKRHPAFPYSGQPPKLQLRYMLKNVTAICEKAGSSLKNICRCQSFYDDFLHFAPTCEEWQVYFPNDPPAMTAIQVGGPLLVPGAHMLLDLIGYVPD